MTASNIRSYLFTRTDRLFFDTNIWLTINNPFGGERNERVKAYTLAYRQILTQGLRIFIDVTVLSEFINRTSRMGFELWKSKDLGRRKDTKFKDYRNTKDYQPTIKVICSVVQSILIDCTLVNTNLAGMPISTLISSLEKGNSDFNDLLVEEICKMNNFTLVTDDADYAGTAVQILTYNQKLLNS